LAARAELQVVVWFVRSKAKAAAGENRAELRELTVGAKQRNIDDLAYAGVSVLSRLGAAGPSGRDEPARAGFFGRKLFHGRRLRTLTLDHSLCDRGGEQTKQ
jgi:hypothetical protein